MTVLVRRRSLTMGVHRTVNPIECLCYRILGVDLETHTMDVLFSFVVTMPPGCVLNAPG